ncbi:MAG: molecular chaperone HtpG [Lachnospiraceae bacterium]|jgi:molecular chaperone HtpG|nr:molecular chaperone HtpG [Lachnospiraceae bacterium]
MNTKTGNFSINSENIFPIIKKWLYSDHDIFFRELISNSCDAITKLKKLEMMGEHEIADDWKAKISVVVCPEEKSIAISDNGLGMTASEVEEYISQIAFSGATDFIEKYKDKTNEEQIIGHFGLGFYSSFMVADEVRIDTLSYQAGAEAVHWRCDGGTEFSMNSGDRTSVGTTVTVFLNDESVAFSNEYRAREVLKKYCSFMPVEIFLSKKDSDDTQTIAASELLDSDTVIEELEEKKDEEKKLKIRKRPELLNEINPLWMRHPNECDREEYLTFYRSVFQDYKEPLFWIHLNMDYPFNLKGILYFPKINVDYEAIEGVIKLYNNQVFIADNIKEVIPEFLLLLKGVIDCPDLPLNVSRSALQNDGFVQKIADYISRKVADKLAGMCKVDKEEYEKHWRDIAPFIKFGCLRDDKFCDKMTDYILFENLDGKYLTLPECLEIAKTDIDEDEDEGEAANKESGGKKGDDETDDSSTPVIAEIVDEDGNVIEDGGEQDEDDDEAAGKEEKVIFYVTDPVQQSQYIKMFRDAKKDAVVLPHHIDQPFISQLESKNEHITFKRIDADLTDDFKSKTTKKAAKAMDKQAEEVGKTIAKALKKDKINVKIEKLKNKKISAMITLTEESRRMRDMAKTYAMPGFDTGMFGQEGETLVLNANHPLVQYVLDNKDYDNVNLICEQLYDLAMLQHSPLEAEAMTKFVARSNEIMLLLAK